LFIKPANKWWDGYNGESTVLIDDFGPEHKVLGYYLKRWSDRYPVTGETKGGTVPLLHTKVIITS